jgi:hypothetical protein
MLDSKLPIDDSMVNSQLPAISGTGGAAGAAGLLGEEEQAVAATATKEMNTACNVVMEVPFDSGLVTSMFIVKKQPG